MKKIFFLIILLFLLGGILWWQTHFSSSSVPSSTSQRSSPSFHFPAFREKTTILVAVGDVMLGRMVNVQMLKYKDFKYPFSKTASFTSAADITFGNLESPIVSNCPTTSVGMIFCARPESIGGLKFAGFDVLSVANNHILNYGQEGLSQTTELLNKNGILPSTNNLTMPVLSKVEGKQSNNLSFGFLSFNLTQNLTISHDRDKLSIIKAVENAKNKVDVLIISLHWGVEYVKEPLAWQKELAYQLIDSGAKIIIGHHPHVTQPTEKYHDGLIFYSLGNFVFDQPWSEETKKGKIAKIIFEGKKIKTFEEIPIYIIDSAQPQFRQE